MNVKNEASLLKPCKAGSRRSQISKIRSELSVMLVEEFGLTLAEAARLLGVTTSAVTRAISRIK